MPEVSRFYGIIVRVQYRDHPPPHFHVQYGEHRAAITIGPPSLMAGYLPARAAGLVIEWAMLHQEELRRAWRQAEAELPIDPIAPLA